MVDQPDPEYLLVETNHEVKRLQDQHAWHRACRWPGSLLRDLAKNVPSSAQLVGLDLMRSFLPPSEGNIQHLAGDICDPPATNLVGVIDLTHVRYTLPGCGRIGIDKSVSNLMDLFTGRSKEPSATNDFLTIAGAFFEKGVMGADLASKLDEAFTKAGLENVCLQRVEFPAGRRLGNEKAAKLSIDSLKVTVPTLAGAAKGKLSVMRR
ncbi:hypothetical protein CCHL11_00157 [Colletotrichum chlorophyti]|uniref:Uncharacterized protein n=1 Tax=Colletotrichum chlorophyti TaxID=708187 RepID=A0A1Q8RV84_9PEZI|nr:hypothetical protein CCHL11_00157 [Colletotrichum chlorophyti]